MPRIVVLLLLTLGGAFLAMKTGTAEQEAVRQQIEAFPDVQTTAHKWRPFIVVALCFLPALAALCYQFAGTLARYVARQFVTIFLLCFFGLFAVWLIADLGDNLDDLKGTNRALAYALELYLARLPEVIVTLLPYSLLLSILYCLGLLSRSREVVAMIQTGRGLGRLTAPFFVGGLLATLLCAGLNYQWAPTAVATESTILRRARGLDSAAEPNIRYRNFDDRRLWMIGSFPHDYQQGAPLRNVTVIQESTDGRVTSILTAATAAWSRDTRDWTFTSTRIADCTEGASPDGVSPEFSAIVPPSDHIVKGWKEVPAELIRPGLPASQLGIPDLNDWLAANPLGTWAARGGHLTQWHYRWAQPLNCLIVVLLATPLGVVFTRRGASGGVAVAVFLCAGMLFVSNVFLSLGDSGHLQPVFAAWLPNLLFGVLALWLFQRRLSGRPIYQTLRKFIPAGA